MQTTVLSNQQIMQEIKNKKLIISPLVSKNLQTASYDVTLGPNFFIQRSPAPEFFCPWNSDHIDKFWDSKVQTPIKITSSEQVSKYGVEMGDEIILIKPRETILGHTQEFIGGMINITTAMKARSSMGRVCVTVCKCAGLGDVGYTNRWTMEIENTSNSSTIVLIVGQRIAQIVFSYTGPVDSSYEKSGSYQKSNDIDEIIKNWKPSDMLPKIKRD